MREWNRASRVGRALRACAIGLLLCLPAAVAPAVDDLLELSLEDLMRVEVTSVSKKAEGKNDAAAAVSVITAEDIRRGGFSNVPEALRSVPGVQVARIDASRWAISIRGFRQEFSNKLLVMIDGRSIYTPIFGGVVWSEQNMAVEDIERIEVIRGPGGVIWGANAVNGVINIITRRAEATQGNLIAVTGGTREYGSTGRHGGRVGEHTHYRVTLKADKTEDYDLDQSYDASDEWAQIRFGVRSDSALTDRDGLTVHLDYYDIDLDSAVGVRDAFFQVVDFDDREQQLRGGDLHLTYDHRFSGGSQLELNASYDVVQRSNVIEEESHTANVDMKHDFELVRFVDVVWGANYRYWTTETDRVGGGVVALDPDDERYHLGSGFVQLEAELWKDRLFLITGTKLSVNSWSGFEYQPSVRVVLKPFAGHTLWGAVSRAVRTPTYVDRSLLTSIGPVSLAGDTDIRSEELLSFEGGWRYYALDWLTFEVTAFYSEYEDLSVLDGPPGGPYRFENAGEAKVRGAEFEIGARPLDLWRLTASYSVIDFNERMPATLLSSNLKDTDPQHQFVLRSLVDLPCDLELDASLYYVDGLPAVTPSLSTRNVEEYIRLDLRVGWEPTDWLEVALVGQNLTDARHAEYYDVQGNQSTQIPRSGYAKLTFDF